MENYYITTTLPYVNAEPHIGFALEIVQADVLARYKRMQGTSVFFNTGTDEHGQKIYEKALEKKKDPRAYVDEYAAIFDRLKVALNLSYDNFIRTTNPAHKAAAQELWQRCEKNGDIYKEQYKIKYCIGCEMEKQDSEIEDGRCPIHPNLELEIREEENYFFKFSKYEKPLLDLYEKYSDFVVPENRLDEIRNFVKSGLKDFSISRLKEKMPWGVPVPGDNEHVQYVWFDALTNYISTLGWPTYQDNFDKYWGVTAEPNAIQIAGKDNLRQQSAMWQAMLMSAGLPTSRQILIHGFVTSEGEKMSKSRGNVVNPFDYVGEYGTEALRYFLLAKMHPFKDNDFTKEKFEEAYNADLANGLGNLVSRVAAMAKRQKFEIPKKHKISEEVSNSIENYRFDLALGKIWERIAEADKRINEKEVFKLKGEEKEKEIAELVKEIRQISFDLTPFMPSTSRAILERYGKVIAKGQPLFPRLK